MLLCFLSHSESWKSASPNWGNFDLGWWNSLHFQWPISMCYKMTFSLDMILYLKRKKEEDNIIRIKKMGFFENYFIYIVRVILPYTIRILFHGVLTFLLCQFKVCYSSHRRKRAVFWNAGISTYVTSQSYTCWNLPSAPSLSLCPTTYITLKKCVDAAGKNQWHSKLENEMFFPF